MAVFQRLEAGAKFESLFWNIESRQHPFHALAGQKRLIKKHIDILEATQADQEEYFWQEAEQSNLLAFLYMISDEPDSIDRSHDQLKCTLERYPNNLNAIVGNIRFLESHCQEVGKAKRERDRYLELQKDLSDTEKQQLICRGELAYACSFIGPDFYQDAIRRYKDLLSVKDLSQYPCLSRCKIHWQYYLAYTYNRMLNAGRKHQLTEKISEVFDEIYALLAPVISSTDEHYRGKAMIDLVDAHKKCETAGSRDEIKFPDDGNPDDFVKRALEAAPSDPHVLERCGRHYRQRARNVETYREAVKILKGLVDKHPRRHVGWHQLGLCYRALWLIVGKYDEAILYTNSARKGNKKGVKQRWKWNKQLKERCTSTDDTTAAAVSTITSEHEGGDSSSTSAVAADAQRPVRLRLTKSVSCDAQASTQERETLQATPQSAPTELPTLRPRNQTPLGTTPKQLKKPDFFDKLRVSNPLTKDEGTSLEYLKLAKESFEKAKEMSNGTAARYIIDLARSLISLDKGDKGDLAEKEFRAANALDSSTDDNDKTYLYEQWALLRHKVMTEQENVENDSKMNVAHLYRKAILYAIRARQRSRMAFYNLRDIIAELLKQDHSNNALQLEYSALYKTMQDFSDSSKAAIVEALAADIETRDTVWRMIALLHLRNHSGDAAIAFTYLTALHKAGQLDLSKAARTADSAISNRQLLIDTTWQTIKQLPSEASEDNNQNWHFFGDIFRWIIGSGQLIAPDPDGPRLSKSSGDVCVLAPSDETPAAERIVKLLQDICGIESVRAYAEGFCDVPCGVPIVSGLWQAAAISKSVIIIAEPSDSRNWKLLRPVLDELMTVQDTDKICLLCDEHTDPSQIDPLYAARWPPRLILSHEDDCQLVHDLLKIMFC